MHDKPWWTRKLRALKSRSNQCTAGTAILIRTTTSCVVRVCAIPSCQQNASAAIVASRSLLAPMATTHSANGRAASLVGVDAVQAPRGTRCRGLGDANEIHIMVCRELGACCGLAWPLRPAHGA